ncbi:MAG: hypothetical protein GX634_01835 [Lentisphaerae bacterium]|nr:hypothetical protein [Lentisphaerota bacterium]
MSNELTTKLRASSARVLADLRTYYFGAALVVFALISRRAGQMSLWGVLGHICLLVLLTGGLLLEHKRRGLARDLAQCRRDHAELEAKVKEQETILLNQRVQMETERLQPTVDEIQRRLLAAFPGFTVSFAVAEHDGYVYPDELVMTAKNSAGEDPAPEDYARLLALARDSAKELRPELAIHWA